MARRWASKSGACKRWQLAYSPPCPFLTQAQLCRPLLPPRNSMRPPPYPATPCKTFWVCMCKTRSACLKISRHWLACGLTNSNKAPSLKRHSRRFSAPTRPTARGRAWCGSPASRSLITCLTAGHFSLQRKRLRWLPTTLPTHPKSLGTLKLAPSLIFLKAL